MSETSYTALQGKVCVVTLEEIAGTNCQWCLTSIPKELALAATHREAKRSGIGGIYQVHFYFLVKASEEADVELKFEMVRISDPTEVARDCTVKVRIIPADSDDFASLDTVAQVRNVDADVWMKYGYPCGVQNN